MAALTSPLLSLTSGSFPDGDSTVTEGFFRLSLLVIVGIIFDIEWCYSRPLDALLNMQLDAMYGNASPILHLYPLHAHQIYLECCLLCYRALSSEYHC